MSAIHRVKEIVRSTVSARFPAKADSLWAREVHAKRYSVAWEYQHRAALGKPTATFASFAAKEGITARFAEHMFTNMNRTRSDVSLIGDGRAFPQAARAERYGASPKLRAQACEDLQKYLTSWPAGSSPAAMRPTAAGR